MVGGTSMYFTALVVTWEKQTVYSPILHTFEEEWVAKEIKRMLNMKVILIQGLLPSGTISINGRNKKLLFMYPNFTLFCHLHAAQHIYWSHYVTVLMLINEEFMWIKEGGAPWVYREAVTCWRGHIAS